MKVLALFVSLLLMTQTQLENLNQKPLVIVTSTVLKSIVEDLAGEKVEVRALMNPSLCPAHQDLRPSDVDLLLKADLILYHGFEPYINRIVGIAQNKTVIGVRGGWNTPESLKEMYKKVANILESNLSLNVSERLEKCLNSINALEQEMGKLAEKINSSGISVLVMQFQSDFIKQLGFNVLAVYPPPETMSAGYVSNLIELGLSNNVTLVIDNLQSGTSVGEEIAHRTGAVHVVLTNFPGTSPEINNVTSMIRYNLKTLEDALSMAELTVEIQDLQRKTRNYMYIIFGFLILTIVETSILTLQRVKK